MPSPDAVRQFPQTMLQKHYTLYKRYCQLKNPIFYDFRVGLQ